MKKLVSSGERKKGREKEKEKETERKKERERDRETERQSERVKYRDGGHEYVSCMCEWISERERRTCTVCVCYMVDWLGQPNHHNHQQQLY